MSNHAQETTGASQPQVGGGWLSHLLGNPHRTDYDAMQGKVKVDCFRVSFLSSFQVFVFKVKWSLERDALRPFMKSMKTITRLQTEFKKRKV